LNRYDSQKEGVCLHGTGVEVLSDILVWARRKDSSGCERINWLNGMAGTGRSTIARTILRASHNVGRLSASFFFSRGREELELVH
jgi:hypothetical protein